MQQGAQAEVQRSTFERNLGAAVAVSDAESMLDLTNVVLRHTEEDVAATLNGNGLQVWGGGTATARGVAIVRNMTDGVLVTDPGSTLTLSEAVIRDTLDTGGDRLGRGLEVQLGAHADVSNVLLSV